MPKKKLEDLEPRTFLLKRASKADAEVVVPSSTGATQKK